MKIEKNDVIRNLRNIKLVIGNGFDLYCKLSTSYKDYFLSDSKKNSNIKEWIEKFNYSLSLYLNFKNVNHRSNWIQPLDFDTHNVWDYFFYFSSMKENVEHINWDWCNIEEIMAHSLQDNTINNLTLYPNWNDVYELINKDSTNSDFKTEYLAAVVYKKNGEKQFQDKIDYYRFLLLQLKSFEKNFGIYIANQYYENYNYENSTYKMKKNFQSEVEIKINSICNYSNIKSIDSFNYGVLNLENIRNIFHNINGDFMNPIFGIDSSNFLAPDPRFIFTKTYRRIELDMNSHEINNSSQFENLIIFGHSLTPSDYYYFFSLFDVLDIVDSKKKFRIIFAFTYYKDENEVNLETSMRVSQLFNEYSKYKGNKESPNRLLDVLINQGKVVFYNI